MTKEEVEVVEALARAFVLFGRLPVLHPSDPREFEAAVHAAQNMVMARVAMRSMQGITYIDPSVGLWEGEPA